MAQTNTLQRLTTLLAFAGSALLGANVALANHYRIPEEAYPPGSFGDVWKVIDGHSFSGDPFLIKRKDPATGEEKEIPGDIPSNLRSAQCGGWNREMSIFGRPASPDGTDPGEESKIPAVEGVPGRYGAPYGNIPSGMALRDETSGENRDGFLFPENVIGKTTACEEACQRESDGKCRVKVNKWCPRTEDWSVIEPCTEDVEYPQFEDPPCLSYPAADGIPPPVPPHTPAKCAAFCAHLNAPQYTYLDCRYPVYDSDANIWRCATDGVQKKAVCTQWWIEDVNTNCKQTVIGRPNRCDGVGCHIVNGRPYRSFFRQYSANFERGKVFDGDEAESPKKPVLDANGAPMFDGNGAPLMRTITTPVGCYGFYDEFDPKTKTTDAPGVSSPDKRCVIDPDGTIDPEKKRGTLDRPGTQTGKGKFGDDPLLPDNPPLLRRTYDGEGDLWFPTLGGAFSLINEKVFEEKYDGDLSTAILTADEAKIEASVQISSDQPFAKSNLLRAFEDTVSNERGARRTIAQWWQKMETDAHRLFTPPIVRLFLPAAWSFGIDQLDPLFVGPPPPNRRGGEGLDSRMQSIEVQLRAGDGLVSQIAAYIERSIMLNVEEEPIPVVIPMASAVELRARAQEWCSWWIRHEDYANGKDPPPLNCEGAPAHVQTLMRRLRKDYPAQIERLRSLRAELPLYIGELLARQRDISVSVGQWMRENMTRYRDFLSEREARMAGQKLWNDAQRALIEVHDEVNMPWCKNDRFTTSIYSLLDPWMPWLREDGTRDLDGGGDACDPGDGLPVFCAPPTDEEDFVFDLSTLQVPTGSLRLPVLNPIQVRLAIPQVPGDIEDPPTEEQLRLPDLPEIPSISADVIARLPTAALPSAADRPAVIETPSMDFSQPEKALEEAKEIIDGMRNTYEEFWSSLDKMQWPAFADEDRALPCPGFDTFPCVHVEMDLLERFTRIWARPALLLKEDFDSVGSPRIPQTVFHASPGAVPTTTQIPDRYACDPADHVCHSVLPEKRKGKDGWQLILPKQNEEDGATFLRDLRRRIRGITLDENARVRNNLRYIVNPEELYPSYGVPGRVDLLPVIPTPSASSSPSI